MAPTASAACAASRAPSGGARTGDSAGLSRSAHAKQLGSSATSRVPSALATGAFWEDLVAAEAPELAHLRATGGIHVDAPVRDDVAGTAAAPPREPLWRGLDDEGRRIRAKLRQDGYAQCPRPEAFEDDPSRLARDAWTDALGGETTLDDLADAMDALRVAGWPPIGVYAFDATWTVVDRLFEVAEAALLSLIHI